ncbi:mucin-5AC-like [Anastrepha ludens]|uniref:mucin-5AC-like n=1 Tax=Anastrepha ludens TaxID=28586 RepID=UPI0023B0CD97|nr:mucin-5AC-like [Anastrepha ludens]
MLPIDSTLAASSTKASHSSPPYTLRCRPSRSATSEQHVTNNLVLITQQLQQQDNKAGGRASDDGTKVTTTSVNIHTCNSNYTNHSATGVTTVSANSNDNPGGGGGGGACSSSHAANSFRNKIPSISIIPLPVSSVASCSSGTSTSTSVVRTVTTSNKATSPPPIFNSPPRSNSSSTGANLQSQRPLLQHQYQQTDKCTILKFDVLRKPSATTTTTADLLSRNIITTAPKTHTTAAAATATVTNAVTFATSAERRQQHLQALQQSIFDQEMSDDAEADAEIAALHQQVLGGNNNITAGSQPIIVKIEPAQSFHIVDESDTRVLSLPLSDADKVGASWIDLKDIAGLQTTSATLVDVCFESPPALLPVSANTSTSTSTTEAMVQTALDTNGVSHTPAAKKRQLVVKVEQPVAAATVIETVMTPTTAVTAAVTATAPTASATATVTRLNVNERSVQQQQQQQPQQLQQQQFQNKGTTTTTGTGITPSSSTGLNAGGAMTGLYLTHLLCEYFLEYCVYVYVLKSD